MWLDYLAPVLAVVATTILANLTKIPMKLRPFVAVFAGVLAQLFVQGGLKDGLQVQDIVDGVLIGLTAVGLYSATKNVKEAIAPKK